MQYRTLGKDKDSVSILGFGCMRLPVLENAPKEIDEAEAIRQIRYGIDQGINYIDTAYPYHYGKSEGLVGKALADGYRERVFLATKLPSYLIETRQDMDRYLDEQLERLQTDHIDFYLLHALNQKYWDNYVMAHCSCCGSGDEDSLAEVEKTRNELLENSTELTNHALDF